MKQRKCDTEKYRRRREREKKHKIRGEIRRRALEAQEYQRQERMRVTRETLLRDYAVQEQRLVNILAQRLCQLSPEYAKELRLIATGKMIRSIWGMWLRR